MLKTDLLKAKSLSAQVASFGGTRSKSPSTGRAYMVEAPAPSSTELQAIIEPLVRAAAATMQAPAVEITPELVKQIIAVMHSLPENDKLEVSKGIRNASSFIYNGTKYGTHEMMHGGASSSSSAVQVYSEVVAGSGTSWTLASVPDAGTLRLFANGQRLALTTDYTLVGAAVTTVLSWTTGTLLADYTV